MALVSRPNWRHISKLLGLRACAFGAARRSEYFSISRDLTNASQHLWPIDRQPQTEQYEPPSFDSMYAVSNPVGPPPTISTGTDSPGRSPFCSVPLRAAPLLVVDSITPGIFSEVFSFTYRAGVECSEEDVWLIVNIAKSLQHRTHPIRSSSSLTERQDHLLFSSHGARFGCGTSVVQPRNRSARSCLILAFPRDVFRFVGFAGIMGPVDDFFRQPDTDLPAAGFPNEGE